MDAAIASFTAITGAPADRAAQYLQLSDGNLENAVQLYFESDLDVTGATTSQAPPVPPPSTRPNAGHASNYPEDSHGVVHVPSDDDEENDFDMADTPPHAAPSRPTINVDDDAEMARRLQEEFYTQGAGAGGDSETEGVRAPMARRTETLVGPDADWGTDTGDMRTAITEQLRMRERARMGIFNQRDTSSIWSEGAASSASPTLMHQRELSAATGGASDSSSKSNLLAELFRPPFDMMFHGPWDSARDNGKEEEKWLLINVQDPSVFDCQVLNRDIWKNEGIKETIRENFLFIQYNKDDPAGLEYIQYYFPAHESHDAYPHIAIVDPRTGEQVKIWSGRPVPQPTDFLMQLHEFLDRYSLKANARNPVAKRKPERTKLDVDRMTEEEMLEMAMQNSLENNGGPVPDDPDALTKSDILTRDKGKAPAHVDSGIGTDLTQPDTNGTAADSPFAQISSSDPHEEPAQNAPGITRIQFRHSGGRVVRRFATSDPVRRIYEWMKAEPLPGKEGQEFELVAMGKNLIESLDTTIEDAGLKNGTVMVEFVGGDEE
ncbi:hypothetical protein NA57DRAFT_38829 [Rhizodiscina lignyota]|uniref:UBX domain-containing protein n=1 Tax=Rhizodiscina lignyota TaxID=1504668 RepID=A0A9P4MAZ7_9PEZI|nr:hypothetical protein NA57DRAFT_38829 [Rhizodiscina lignyota]